MFSELAAMGQFVLFGAKITDASVYQFKNKFIVVELELLALVDPKASWQGTR